MENKYYDAINPLDKETEILTLFREYSPKSFQKTDDGYDWLGECDTKCVVFTSPYSLDSIEVTIEYMDEFTIYFSCCFKCQRNCEY